MNPGVTITMGPQDWQIFQRDARGVAQISIAGSWCADEREYAVQARLVDENSQAPVARHLDWQDAEMNVEAQTFRITLHDVPQGGLYRLETRIRRPLAGDRRALRGDYVHHLGVGDLYLITGQSNASGTGKGSAPDGPQLGVHLFANDETWKLATHPLEDATNTLHPITITSIFHGSSPWLTFGKRILARTNVPIGLIPTALGGSSITQWVTDDGTPGRLFENMLDMWRKAGGAVAGILWYQGESDANVEGVARYTERFQKLTALWRKMLGQPELAIFTGQLHRVREPENPGADRAWSRMREIQRSLAHELPNVYLAVTMDTPHSDEIHNNAIANVIIGERFADLALEHIYGIPLQSHFPEPDTIRFTDTARREVVITWKNLSGDWTPVRCIDDFSVEDAHGSLPVEAARSLPDNSVCLTLFRSAEGDTTLHGLYGRAPVIALRDDNCRCITPFTQPVANAVG